MKNLISVFVVAAISIGGFGCSEFPKKSTILAHTEIDSTKPIAFIADPQIHNIYGLGLKQMSAISDIVSKVAVRPPELNILAPLVLETLTAESSSQYDNHAIVVLGDATNIACSGEYETFLKSIQAGRTQNLPLFMAHGNHDSYLMGTVNHYFPLDSQTDWKPKNMGGSMLPTDESWWGTTAISSSHYSNWRDGCFQPVSSTSNQSTPMNKSRWLAKYIDFLKNDGLFLVAGDEKTESTNDSVVMIFSSAEGSILNKLNFSAKGRWYRPKFGDTPSESYFTSTYKSFLVQSIDFDKTRMIIIDTSLCEKARGGWMFFFSNAGQNACIGSEQLEVIEEYISQVPSNSKLVLAGHFPLDDLSNSERKKLLKVASASNSWVYMSAHSHHAISQLDWASGVEINVGSTTDWPMEASNVWFESNQATPVVSTIVNQNAGLPQYTKSNYQGESEVCRHLAAAKKLANLKVNNIVEEWISPKTDSKCEVSKQGSWEYFGNELAKHMETINKRFHSEPNYKKAMLSIAAAASESEYKAKDLVELIP